MSVSVAECAMAVVAGHTALRTDIREMLRGRNGADLFGLRQTLSLDRMTLVTSEPRWRAVIGVTEPNAVGAGVAGGRPVNAEGMTGTARRESTRLLSRRVTFITIRVSIQTRRY